METLLFLERLSENPVVFLKVLVKTLMFSRKVEWKPCCFLGRLRENPVVFLERLSGNPVVL